MKTICMTCKKHLSGIEEDPMVSHGLCLRCQNKMTLEFYNNNRPVGNLELRWYDRGKVSSIYSIKETDTIETIERLIAVRKLTTGHEEEIAIKRR